MVDNPIIDIHQHALKAKFADDGTPARNPITGTPSPATTDQQMITETLKEMDKNNITQALIDNAGGLETLGKWVETAPTRFIPSINLGGNPITPSIKQVRELLENGSIKAIGEICTQYYGIAPNDPKLDPYYALAEEYSVPTQIHLCGEGALTLTTTFQVKYGNPILIEDVLQKYPDLHLCVCHAGIPFTAKMASLLYMYPRLYADISYHNSSKPRNVFYDHLKGLIDYVETRWDRPPSSKQLMFGSDLTLWPETISMAVDTVQSAPFLSDQQKRDIFYNNAKRFLRL